MNAPGYAPHEIVTAEPTRSARLKWVVVVDTSLDPGRMVNAVACVSATVGHSVGGLIGPGCDDAEGGSHPGLPWAGCTVLRASTEQLARIHRTALDADDVFTVDMPLSAQTNRVYDDYLRELTATPIAQIAPTAVSIIGPRDAVERIVKRLKLL